MGIWGRSQAPTIKKVKLRTRISPSCDIQVNSIRCEFIKDCSSSFWKCKECEAAAAPCDNSLAYRSRRYLVAGRDAGPHGAFWHEYCSPYTGGFEQARIAYPGPVFVEGFGSQAKSRFRLAARGSRLLRAAQSSATGMTCEDHSRLSHCLDLYRSLRNRHLPSP